MLDPGQRREEEGRLLRLPWGLLRLVALLDDFQVEQRLPAGAWEEREGDELAVKLRRGGENISGLVLDCEL